MPQPKTLKDLLKPKARKQAALDNANASGRMEVRATGDNTHELLIYGDIGENWWGEDTVTAKAVISELQNLTTNHIVVCINSYGGSVSDGLAIYNALRGMSAAGVKITCRIEGVAVSIASFIAMAADEGEVQAYENTLYMVHAPWSGVMGNAAAMREAADVLDAYANAMVTAYQRHTNSDVDAMLKDGADHWFTATEAAAEGFVQTVLNDENGELDEGAEAAFQARYQNVPLAAVASLRMRNVGGGSSNTPLPNQPAAAAATPTEEPNMADPKKPAAKPNDDNVVAIENARKDAAAEALAADQTRRTEIKGAFKKHLASNGMASLQDECLEDLACSSQAARNKLLDALGAMQQPVNNGNGTVVDMDRASARTGMAEAILARATPGQHKVTEASKRFRGMNLIQMAGHSLAQAGVNTAGMTPAEIAVKALHTNTDFPIILENTVGRTLREAYEYTPRTFTSFCNQATLPDFKEVKRAQLAGAPSLDRVVEGAEYKQGTMGESAESYRAFKYGKEIAITYETLVNDDMDAFSRVPRAFGASAADLESDLVYAALTGNSKMSDGKAVFHADHKNMGTAAMLSVASLSEMRAKMRKQKGLPSEKNGEGRVLNLMPAVLLVPAALETEALKLTTAGLIANNSSDVNPFAGQLRVVVDPRLDETSTTAWYLIADPMRVDTIEYAYLDGSSGIEVSTRIDERNDSFIVKARHVFAAKAIDYRGMAKNAGQAPA